jgi:hypothetical protein
MSGHFATIRRLALAGVAVLALATCVSVAPAAADSFSFSYRSGPAYGYPHYRHHRHHHHRYWGPAYSYRYYAPPPVYYAPPPAVVYVPAPAYGPSSYAAPVAAQPTSPVYQSANGQYCREYQTTVHVAGRPQPSYGTACLQPDGVWRVVN